MRRLVWHRWTCTLLKTSLSAVKSTCLAGISHHSPFRKRCSFTSHLHFIYLLCFLHSVGKAEPSQIMSLLRLRRTSIDGETSKQRLTDAMSNMPHANRVIFIYDCDVFTQEYNKHVLGRAIPLEQIDRARAEAPTDLYIDHLAAQRRQENVVVSPYATQKLGEVARAARHEKMLRACVLVA